MKTYKVGIIGMGFIGRVHSYAHINMPLYYEPLPFRTRITHVCNSRMERAEAAKELVNAETATTDYRDITENPEIDVVHICSPNHLHKEQLLSAISREKHIFCDKPLVAEFAEVEEIQTALSDYTGVNQMTFQLRFFTGIMRAKQIINSGLLGRILEFRAIFLHAGSANPEAPLKWKLSAKAGGGVIADLGSHAMDISHYLVGDFDRLIANTMIAYPARPSVEDPARQLAVDAEDAVMMLCEMKNGACGMIEATKLATGSEDELRLEVHGSRGALRFNSMRPHVLEYYDATQSDKPIGGLRGWTGIDVGQRYPTPAGFPGPKMSIGWIRSHMACLYNFMDAVHNNTHTQPDLAQGIYVQKLMDCARKSAASGTWVHV